MEEENNDNDNSVDHNNENVTDDGVHDGIGYGLDDGVGYGLDNGVGNGLDDGVGGQRRSYNTEPKEGRTRTITSKALIIKNWGLVSSRILETRGDKWGVIVYTGEGGERSRGVFVGMLFVPSGLSGSCCSCYCYGYRYCR